MVPAPEDSFTRSAAVVAYLKGWRLAKQTNKELSVPPHPLSPYRVAQILDEVEAVPPPPRKKRTETTAFKRPEKKQVVRGRDRRREPAPVFVSCFCDGHAGEPIPMAHVTHRGCKAFAKRLRQGCRIQLDASTTRGLRVGQSVANYVRKTTCPPSSRLSTSADVAGFSRTQMPWLSLSE